MARVCVLFVCAASAAGCATTSKGPEKVLGYTDHNLFVIAHHDPAHGGRIVGTVCAADIDADARPLPAGVRLVGAGLDRHETAEGMTLREGRAWVPTSGQPLPMLLETRD